MWCCGVVVSAILSVGVVCVSGSGVGVVHCGGGGESYTRSVCVVCSSSSVLGEVCRCGGGESYSGGWKIKEIDQQTCKIHK